ncbi:MAG TPA: hypothetical protein VGI95_02390 [Caulobacteraceae bacterium]|jgi:hypothetical protein
MEGWTDEQVAEDALQRRIMSLGCQGYTRAEIGAEVGMNEDQMAAREADDPVFARLMVRADEAKVGWWARQILAECEATGDLRLWVVAFRMRYPDAPLPWERNTPPAPAPEPHQPRWRRGGFY